jgi:hypothetical protein
MTWLIVPENKLAELAAINAQFTDRQCTPVVLADNTLVTSADKLADEYWAAWHEFLNGLAQFIGEPEFITTGDQE